MYVLAAIVYLMVLRFLHIWACCSYKNRAMYGMS